MGSSASYLDTEDGYLYYLSMRTKKGNQYGRKRLPVVRDWRVQVNLTEREALAVADAAGDVGLTVSEWGRRLLVENLSKAGRL